LKKEDLTNSKIEGDDAAKEEGLKKQKE